MTDAQELDDPKSFGAATQIPLSRVLDLLRLLRPDALWDASFVQRVADSIDHPLVASGIEEIRPRRKLGHLAGLLDLTPEEAFEPLEEDELAAWEGRPAVEAEA